MNEGTALAIISAAIEQFNNDESWFAKEIRWDRQYLLDFIEHVADAGTMGTTLSEWERSLVDRLTATEGATT